jgi:hypothetical protein
MCLVFNTGEMTTVGLVALDLKIELSVATQHDEAKKEAQS